MLRECTHSSTLYTKAHENSTISKKHKAQSRSIHLSPTIAKNNLGNANTALKGDTINKFLNLTYLAEAPTPNHQLPFNSVIQRPATTSIKLSSHSLNNSYVRIPCALKYPKTIKEMSDVIKQAEEYTGGKSASSSPNKRARIRAKNQLEKLASYTPIMKSIPSYSKYPKEMDYKTFAMIYRIKQRDRGSNISCMSLYT
jgi:hypothetical protein